LPKEELTIRFKQPEVIKSDGFHRKGGTKGKTTQTMRKKEKSEIRGLPKV